MIQAIEACQPLAVPTPIMAAIVQVESNGNPYAIGVVNGALRRQPRNLNEAQATVNLLHQQGYNYSIGAAQINKTNFQAYNIHPHTSGFDFCSSVKTGAKILAECYSRSKFDWLKAFSCYYSGNFTTGFEHGYVQKVSRAFSDLNKHNIRINTNLLLPKVESNQQFNFNQATLKGYDNQNKDLVYQTIQPVQQRIFSRKLGKRETVSDGLIKDDAFVF
jgi:hypothetical protein